MRPLSLRAWLLGVSVLFAALVVGGISLTAYVIVSDGMQVVSYRTAQRLTATAAAAVNGSIESIERQWQSSRLADGGHYGAADSGTTTAQVMQLLSQLRGILGTAGLAEAEFALYDSRDEPLWQSSRRALVPQLSGKRGQARSGEQALYSSVSQGHALTGLLTEADLGATVGHVPVTLPGGERAVLDVTYMPRGEEEVLDAVRPPMAILAVSAMLIMVVLMQTSLAWVLNLVDDLRTAADSIDAGRLDERLPASARNEIGDLARSINRLIERLQRRAEAQSRFVADASHELATPVAGIRGYTSILRGWGAEDPKLRAEAVDAIDRESARMARLSNDLLNLLHADQGLRLRSERFDLNVLIRERLAATASRYLDKDIEYAGPEEESLLMVGDPDRVEDVLSILLDNAGKYTPELGRVTVRSKRKRDTVVVEVSDSGPGIPAGEIDRVFDRFFRSERARSQGEGGFGLGLAIAKSIVDNMGGSIEVRSIEGAGTTFVVVLPRGRT